MSEVVEILSRQPILVIARCAGCGRKYQTSQPAAAVRKLTRCQVCKPPAGNAARGKR